MNQSIIIHQNTDLTSQPGNESLPLDANPAAVYIASLSSKRSQRVMRHNLDKIAFLLVNSELPSSDDSYRGLCLSFPWQALRYQHTAALRGKLADHYKHTTANNMLCALRGVLKECWQLGYTSAEDYHRARSVKAIRGETLPAGRELERGELDGLLHACNRDNSPAGIRDGAIIALLYMTGVRRAEVVALELSDFDAEKGSLIVRHGKGNKERAVYAGAALAYVQNWLAIRGDAPGALFRPINKGGAISARPMTSQAIYNMLKKRGTEAGIKDFSPHDFRRTFVSDLLDAGADIATVSKLAGHASVTTTARYDRRPEEAKRKAISLLHIPAPTRAI